MMVLIHRVLNTIVALSLTILASNATAQTIDSATRDNGLTRFPVWHLKVENFQKSGDIVSRRFYGVLVSADGFILTLARPLTGANPSPDTVRTAVTAERPTAGGNRGGDSERSTSIPLTQLYIDETRDITLLTFREKNERLSGVARIRTDPIGVGTILSAIVPINGVNVTFNVQVTAADRSQLRIVRNPGDRDAPDLGLPWTAPIVDESLSLVGFVSTTRSEFGSDYVVVRVDTANTILAKAFLSSDSHPDPLPPRTDTLRINRENLVHGAAETVLPFSETYVAPTGYTIQDANVLIGSANGLRDKPTVKVINDGKAAVVQFGLLSGPIWDQRRGWFDGELRVQLVPER